MLLDNTPSNPLRVVFPESVLRELLEFARRHDLWVLSDDVYEYFMYGMRHVSPAALDDDDRVFSVFSLMKTYAMTGVRVGYPVTPPGFAGSMRTVQEASISCVSSPGSTRRSQRSRATSPMSRPPGNATGRTFPPRPRCWTSEASATSPKAVF